MATSSSARMTLPRATVLRAKAAFALGRARRDGTPRSRFLAEAAEELHTAARRAFAVAAAVTAAAALGSPVPGALFAASALFAGAALATTRRPLPSLRASTLAGALAPLVPLAIAPAAPAPLPLLPLAIVAATPLPPVLAAVIAGAAAAATVVHGVLSGAPGRVTLSGTLVVAFAGAGAIALRRAAHREALTRFRSRERQGAALLRLAALQEQLVVTMKLEAMRVFVGGMSHELNNALAVADGNLTVAIRKAPEAAGPLEKARGGLGRIRAIVDRLRAFALAAPAVRDRVDLAGLLDFAVTSAVGDRENVTIQRNYADIGSANVPPSALGEALFLVLRNAVEAVGRGAAGRGVVSVTATRSPEGAITVRVRDDGPGLAKEVLARVFDPFYKPNLKEVRTGLGLSAALGLVHSAGGTLRVQSAPGRGTEVAIHLPP